MAGRDPFVNAALILRATERLIVATGIATIYSRDPLAMSSVHKTLTDAFPGRFLLGLGVSHQPAVEGIRKHEYGPPLTAIREYLDGMDAAPYFALAPEEEPVRALAALGPKMLALAAERAIGAHPYFVPVEHTAIAREIMGPDAWLMPEQMVVLESDATKAREIARGAMSIYLTLPNYVNNLRRLGWVRRGLRGRRHRPARRRDRRVGRRGGDPRRGSTSTSLRVPTTSACRSSARPWSSSPWMRGGGWLPHCSASEPGPGTVTGTTGRGT